MVMSATDFNVKPNTARDQIGPLPREGLVSQRDTCAFMAVQKPSSLIWSVSLILTGASKT